MLKQTLLSHALKPLKVTHHVTNSLNLLKLLLLVKRNLLKLLLLLPMIRLLELKEKWNLK